MPKCLNCKSEMLRMFSARGDTCFICGSVKAHGSQVKGSHVPEIYCGAPKQPQAKRDVKAVAKP